MASRLTSPIRLATVLALLTTIGLSTILVAQTPVPPEQRTPPRDAKPPAERGTAIIRGRVVAGDTGRPLRRARITLTSGELGPDARRTASTNLDGAFEIKELRAARYRLSVARGGYLSLEYGQRRPGEQGRPVQVASPDQRMEAASWPMTSLDRIAGNS